MSRDDTYLVDILESAKIALDYVAGKSWDEFFEDMQCQDAVLRRTLAPHAAQVSRSSAKPPVTCPRKLKRNILKFPGVI